MHKLVTSSAASRTESEILECQNGLRGLSNLGHYRHKSLTKQRIYDIAAVRRFLTNFDQRQKNLRVATWLRGDRNLQTSKGRRSEFPNHMTIISAGKVISDIVVDVFAQEPH